jgi:hypothetical protein
LAAQALLALRYFQGIFSTVGIEKLDADSCFAYYHLTARALVLIEKDFKVYSN